MEGVFVSDRAADAGSIDAVVRAEGPGLLRLAFGLTGERAAAEDLLQESIVRMIRARGSITGSPGAFLRRTLINLHTDTYRRQRRLRDITAGLARTAAVTPSAQESERVGLDVDLQRALGDLPVLHRQVIALRYLADLPFDEIAAMLGRRPGSVRRIGAEAQAALRRSLADYDRRTGVTDEPG